MQLKPYVGITGFTENIEVETIAQIYNRLGFTRIDSNHKPMFGFLVSYKTLNEEKVTNKRYPKINLLNSLMKSVPENSMNTIHYNSRYNSLDEQIDKLFDATGIYSEKLCNSLQLNIAWPDIKEVKKIKNRYHDLSIILQLSSKSMEGLDLTTITERTSHYIENIS